MQNNDKKDYLPDAINSRLNYYGSFDVIVCGGGPAGIAAAYSAAELGANVLILEKNGYLGGMAVSGLPLLSFHDLHGNQVVRGFPQFLVDKLVEKGGSPGHIKINNCHFSYFTPIDPEILKLVTQEILTQKGVKILLNCLVRDVIVKNSIVKAIVFETKSGSFLVESNAIIDATGDGDVIAKANGSFEYGAENGLCQPMSLMFKLSNVNIDKLPDLFTEEIARINDNMDMPSLSRILHLTGNFRRWENEIKKYNLFDGNANHRVWFMPFRKGELYINTIKIFENFLDIDEMSRAEIEGRKQVFLITKFLKKHVPGFENAYVSNTNCNIGLRESRRIVGDYTLTEDDVKNGRIFNDTIALFGYPMDIHDLKGVDSKFIYIKNDGAYGIPYRILIPRDNENIIAAGRCVSATRNAFASLRVMVGAMAIGQAAGVASFLKTKQNLKSFRDISIKDLRDNLLNQNVILNYKRLE